jgi:hypothetical protein
LPEDDSSISLTNGLSIHKREMEEINLTSSFPCQRQQTRQHSHRIATYQSASQLFKFERRFRPAGMIPQCGCHSLPGRLSPQSTNGTRRPTGPRQSQRPDGDGTIRLSRNRRRAIRVRASHSAVTFTSRNEGKDCNFFVHFQSGRNSLKNKASRRRNF